MLSAGPLVNPLATNQIEEKLSVQVFVFCSTDVYFGGRQYFTAVLESCAFVCFSIYHMLLSVSFLCSFFICFFCLFLHIPYAFVCFSLNYNISVLHISESFTMCKYCLNFNEWKMTKTLPSIFNTIEIYKI